MNGPGAFLLTAVTIFSIAKSASAADIVVDLAAQKPGTTSTIPSTAESVKFRIVNRIANGNYDIKIEQKPYLLPALDVPKVSVPAAADACALLRQHTKALGEANDEATVGKEVSAIKDLLERGSCSDSSTTSAAILAVVSTTYDVPGDYSVRGGLQITVSRKISDTETAIWIVVVSPPSRGTWLTTYGLTVAANRDQQFFAQATPDGKYSIAQGSDLKGSKFYPAVYFSWLGASRERKDWAFSPTAGLGLTTPSLFVGYSAIFNQNVIFTAGGGWAKQTRLKAQYHVGQVTSENLASDQLQQDVIKPTLVFSVSFRVVSNPFGGGDESKKTGDSPAGGKPGAPEKKD